MKNLPQCQFGRLLLCGSLLLVSIGCDEQLPTNYGSRSNTQSVNGTSAFSHLFTAAGHRVRATATLAPRLQREADIIVWFASDMDAPSDEVTAWLDEWLAAKPDRCLIYVGRDYDAAPDYWDRVASDAPAEIIPELNRRGAEAMQNFRQRRNLGSYMSRDQCDWFTIDQTWNPRSITQIDGSSALLDGVDRKNVQLKLYGNIEPAFGATPLIWSGNNILMSEQYPYQGRFILVANGSFLLNMPLLDPQNRTLATRLIEYVAPPGSEKNVVFLQTMFGDPRILDKDESPGAVDYPAPLDKILLHLAILGLVFCFARWPIFGRPREIPPRSSSDFGQHIEALGKMLARSRDQAYATTRLLHYQQRRRDGSQEVDSAARSHPLQRPPESPTGE